MRGCTCTGVVAAGPRVRVCAVRMAVQPCSFVRVHLPPPS